MGSLAALTLPFEAQATPVPTGIPSEFAFGGEFKFGELSLYLHSDQEAMNSFFNSVACSLNPSCLLFSHWATRNLRAYLALKPSAQRNLLIFEKVSGDDILAIKDFLVRNPKHIALCATASNVLDQNSMISTPDSIFTFKDIHPGTEVVWGPAYLVKPFKTRGKSKEEGMCFSKDSKGIKFISNIKSRNSI